MKNVLTGLLFSFIFIGLFTHTHAQVYTSYIPNDQRKCAQMYPNNCAQQSYYYTQGCYTYYYNGVTNTTTLTGNSCQVNQNQYSNQYIYSYPSTYTYTQPSYQTYQTYGYNNGQWIAGYTPNGLFTGFFGNTNTNNNAYYYVSSPYNYSYNTNYNYGYNNTNYNYCYWYDGYQVCQ